MREEYLKLEERIKQKKIYINGLILLGSETVPAKTELKEMEECLEAMKKLNLNQDLNEGFTTMRIAWLFVVLMLFLASILFQIGTFELR